MYICKSTSFCEIVSVSNLKTSKDSVRKWFDPSLTFDRHQRMKGRELCLNQVASKVRMQKRYIAPGSTGSHQQRTAEKNWKSQNDETKNYCTSVSSIAACTCNRGKAIVCTSKVQCYHRNCRRHPAIMELLCLSNRRPLLHGIRLPS